MNETVIKKLTSVALGREVHFCTASFVEQKVRNQNLVLGVSPLDSRRYAPSLVCLPTDICANTTPPMTYPDPEMNNPFTTRPHPLISPSRNRKHLKIMNILSALKGESK